MDIKPLGSQPSRKTPADYFTGTVWQDPIIEAPEPARVRAAWVRFEPGARTAWHTHPLGQTIHITQGEGRVQAWGGPIKAVRAGDTVFFAPGEKHWHGAAPNMAMTHLAMQEALDGNHVELDGEGVGRAVRWEGGVANAPSHSLPRQCGHKYKSIKFEGAKCHCKPMKSSMCYASGAASHSNRWLKWNSPVSDKSRRERQSIPLRLRKSSGNRKGKVLTFPLLWMTVV